MSDDNDPIGSADGAEQYAEPSAAEIADAYASGDPGPFERMAFALGYRPDDERPLTPEEVEGLYVDPRWDSGKEVTIQIPTYDPVPARDLVPEPPAVDLPDAAVEFVERLTRTAAETAAMADEVKAAGQHIEALWQTLEAHTAKLNRLEARLGYPEAAEVVEIDGWVVPLPRVPGTLDVPAPDLDRRSIAERLVQTEAKLDALTKFVETMLALLEGMDGR